MAKAEFYEIVIKDKKEHLLVNNVSLNDNIKKYLKSNSDTDNFCQKGSCAVILNEYISKNTDNTTFDFAKLTNKKVISTLISEPTRAEDTFKEYHKKILETTTYNDSEKIEVEKAISLHKEDKLINIFRSMKIDKFKINKIILDFGLLGKKELSVFENKIMKRLKKDSIYFNIIENFDNSKHKLLVYQNLSDGLDIKYLEDYLNTHLLVSEKFKVYFHKLYDADFMDLLHNGELKKFIFSYDLENKSNLLDKNLFNPLYSIGSIFGKNVTKVEIKSKNDEILDNKKLIDFFDKAIDTGFLDSCELMQKGGGNKKIDFKDKKLNIEYSENITINNINMAVLFFNKALENKMQTVKKRLGL